MRLLFILIGLMLSQFTNGQQITKKFDHTLMEENFSTMSSTWPQTFTTDNIAITQDGKYEMKRINETTGNYIFPKIEPQTNYELITLFEFVGKSKNQRVGVLLSGQEASNGGILIEINNKRSYRVSKLGGTKSYYTGTPETDGWIKDKDILNKKKNILQVKCYQRVYDLYFNNKFIYSFTEIEYAKGSLGLFIGSLSHAYCKSFVIKTDPPIINMDKSEQDILTDQITKLKEDNKQKSMELERLKAMKANDESNIAAIKALENKNLKLQDEINSLNSKIGKLNDSILGLELFKKTVQSGTEGDAVNVLSTKLETNRQTLNATTEQLNDTKIGLKNANSTINYLSSELAKLRDSDSILRKKVLFMTRQIDWMTQKMQSDTSLFRDSLDDGTGFIFRKNYIPIDPEKLYAPALNFIEFTIFVKEEYYA